MKKVYLLPLMLIVSIFAGQGLHAQTCPPPLTVSTSQDTSSFLLTISLGTPDPSWLQCEYQVQAEGTTSWKKARRAPGDFQVNMLSNLEPSTNYSLRARCACSISPLEVSPFGPVASFSTPDAPIARLAMAEGQVSLFPNPAASVASVRYQSDMDGQVLLSVYDLTGRVVFEQQADVVAGTNMLQLDLSNLDNGQYFFRAVSGATEYRETLQIVR
ncbi:MAG: T9SS type A sorting domain-containing protein [Bacteroidetes bacterium]|nr:T9SS type A sorting domain-containing protein [Bacteroidota bacterium]